jgi:hypothetical protein
MVVRQIMVGAPLLDESRSDRGWQLLLALFGTFALTCVSGFLLVAALLDDSDLLLRVLVGGLFGVGFVAVFGWASLTLIRRLLAVPVRVRIDHAGIRVGAQFLAWSEVQSVDIYSGGLPRKISIVFQASGSQGSLPVPGLFPVAQGKELVLRLGEHFLSSGLAIPIVVK